MKANNRSQHVLIRLLGAFVCGVGLVTLSADMARSGHTELPCDTMTITDELTSGTTYDSGQGFQVYVELHGPGPNFPKAPYAVSFASKSYPVAHFGVRDGSKQWRNYKYDPPVTQDASGRRGHHDGSTEISGIRFCYLDPSATPKPKPSATPPPTPLPTTTTKPTSTPTPTLKPTESPSPTQPPTAPPSPSPTPTPPPSPAPTASASPSPAPTASASPSPTPSVTPSTPSQSPASSRSPTISSPPSPDPTPIASSSPSPDPIPSVELAPGPAVGPTDAPPPSLEPGARRGLPPRSFAGSIPRPDELTFDVTVAGQSLLLALLFMLLAAFPGQLANKTWEANHEEIARWFARGGAATDRIRNALAGFWQRPYGILLFVALTAALYGFLSPDFGPTVDSAVALAGILGGLAVVILAFELPMLMTHRRVNRERGRLQVIPLTIALGIACVVISRIAEFQPGYLYGLVATFAFTGTLQRSDEARAHALTGVWMLVIALAAWLAMPSVEHFLASQPLLLMGVSAGLATVFVGGLEGLMFELVPLRFLRGEAVYQWRRTVWAILFLAAGFAFAYIMLDPSHGYLGSTRISPLVPAVILFVSFGIASILFWSYFRFRRRPKATS